MDEEQVAPAVGEALQPHQRLVELGFLLLDLTSNGEQRVEELLVVADDVTRHELDDGLVLDPRQRRRLQHPPAERLPPLVGERVEAALPGLAGTCLGDDVPTLLEPLRLRVQPRRGTAYGDRSAPWAIWVASQWTDPAEDVVHRDWTRGFSASVAPWVTGSAYVNAIGGDATEARTVAAYGGPEKFERLRELKRVWDPENLFRRNPNIAP